MNVRVHQSGISFPDSARGRVFSAHEKALNLQIDGAPELATLVSDEAMMTVTSLLISPRPRAASSTAPALLRLAAIERGCGFEARDGQISFDSGLTLVLDASAAPDFTGRIEPLRDGGDTTRRPASPRPSQTFVDELLAAAGGDEPGGGRDPRTGRSIPGVGTDAHEGRPTPGVGFAPLAVAMRGGPPYPSELSNADPFAGAAWNIVRPILAGDVEPQERLGHAFSLVGLGGGFTPSGDDFLVGLLAARTLIGEPSPAGPVLERLLGRCAATTLPGATIVRQALRGRFPAYLCRFAQGFASAATDARAAADPRTTDPAHARAGADRRARAAGQVRELVAIAARHGHSSGIDAVTGFGFGLLTEN